MSLSDHMVVLYLTITDTIYLTTECLKVPVKIEDILSLSRLAVLALYHCSIKIFNHITKQIQKWLTFLIIAGEKSGNSTNSNNLAQYSTTRPVNICKDTKTDYVLASNEKPFYHQQAKIKVTGNIWKV